MRVVKRVEIITGQQEFPQVLDALESCGITGYALLRNVLGKGDKKVYSFDSISGEVENLMIVTTIADDSLNKLIEALRPAMWVIH